MEALNDWSLEERIIALKFDTTASDTRVVSDTCVLVEQKLGRHLLNLAYYHHIVELVLDKSYVECMRPSTGPQILLFTRCRDRWKSLNTTPQELHPMYREETSQPLKDQEEKLLENFSRHFFHSGDLHSLGLEI
ncbi:hypothetical protein Pcinc_006464 [Petrolisthes cinctipes]|uniref:Uncharacterized protein n=1 Tax=Petrolisthes cinctipes TaxID=88211 RepID=A0AAE1KZI3_PETCI|nr:hypothetical protein Pcinc_006464 [Petrolisthes cinctipes]